MKSALLVLFVAKAALSLVCDQNSLCDDVMRCTSGLSCLQPDALGIGRCCLDSSASTAGFITQYPIFGTTPYQTGFTQYPNGGFNTVSPHNPGTYPGSCQDLPNPTTGVSDCHLRANLCFDSNYYDVMTRQCPQTCGRCGGQFGGTTAYSIYPGTMNTNYPISGCVDRLNPLTGQSDCARRATLCFDQLYQNLMKQQCPKTCGFCSRSGVTSGIGLGITSGIEIGFTSTPRYNLFTQPGSFTRIGENCVDAVNSRTGRSDCGTLAYFCKRSDYATLMRTQCPRTCGFC